MNITEYGGATIWQGDVRQILPTLPDNAVQTVVTSPPFWGLRDYGTATWIGGDPGCDHAGPPVRSRFRINQSTGTGMDKKNSTLMGIYRAVCGKCGAVRVDSQIGLEETPEDYVEGLVAVFREIRRILRPDGTLWLNLGDSYNGSGGAGGDYGPGGLKEGQPRYPGRRVPSLKPKDLIGIPWRVALALQADGWYLRSDIIWHKPNPMPESVTDRPTRAHEYIFLLTKSERYFYDADAIREPHSAASMERVQRRRSSQHKWADTRPGAQRIANDLSQALHVAGRNKRSVWTVNTSRFPGAHFATFPATLPELCIQAGTSPQACPHCGTPWRRVRGQPQADPDRSGGNKRQKHIGNTFAWEERVGWEPMCSCADNDGSGRCIVLDPFWGSGTTGAVALTLGRRAWGVELNPEYVRLSLETRLKQIQPTLLTQL